jgi:hypothetical protein
MRVDDAMHEVVGPGASVLARRLGDSEISRTDNDNGTVLGGEVFPLRPHGMGDIWSSILSGFDAIVNIDAMVMHHRE